ncbi:MAG: hypothetical protein FWD49_06880 [Firmicutes bacterium]|nr:hypothetical protein [Bacillota bacterium]
MKKFTKALLIALLIIVPCAIGLSACFDGESTPPSYEAVAKGHYFGSTGSFYTKTANAGAGSIYSYTNKSINGIIEEYLGRLEVWYEDILTDTEAENMELGNIAGTIPPVDERIEDFFNSFVKNQSFVLSVPDAENKFAGTMKIMSHYLTSQSVVELASGINFTINEENGAMQFTGIDGSEHWGKSSVAYSYRNGAITVEINVAEIVKEVASLHGISQSKRNQVPALWVRFDLR